MLQQLSILRTREPRAGAEPLAMPGEDVVAHALIRKSLGAAAVVSPEALLERCEAYHQALRLPDLRSLTQKQTKRDVDEFLSTENRERLGALTQSERLAELTIMNRSLWLAPSRLATDYFVHFPSDLPVIGKAFEIGKKVGWEYEDERDLIAACTPILVKTGLLTERSGVPDAMLMQMLEVASRREIASGKLLSERELRVATDPVFSKQIEETCQLIARVSRYHHEITEPEALFGKRFDALAPTERFELLRALLTTHHNRLIDRGCYRSAITKGAVADYNQSLSDGAEPKARFGHSVVHSMKHPLKLFDQDWLWMLEPMGEPHSPNVPVDRFPLERAICATLERFTERTPSVSERQENCDVLIEFWNKNRDPLYAGRVAAALSAQDTDYAAHELLHLIRTTEGYRNHLSAVLHRLEFGRIGISEDGVRYLDTVYDLRELNNPDYFVHRLTSQGDIGVFDEQARLIKYFCLADPRTTGSSVTPEVLDFTVRTLFLEHPSDSAALRAEREVWVEQFRTRYFGAFDENFQERTGVQFKNLTFREQGGYVQFIAKSSSEEIERAEQFVRRHGEQGLRIFVTLQGSATLLNEINKLDRHLTSEAVNQVVEQLGSIVQAATTVHAHLKRTLSGMPAVNEALIDATGANLLRRAESFIHEIVKEAQRDDAQQPLRLSERVANLGVTARTEVLFFGAVLDELKGVEGFAPALAHNFVTHSCRAVDLPPEFRAQMEEVSREQNARTYPDPAYRNVVFNEFLSALKAPSQYMHFVRIGPHVISFCRSDPTSEWDGILLASLNTNPNAEGGGIGMTLLGDVVNALGADADLVALVGPGRQRLLDRYRALFGFNPVDTLDDGTKVIRRRAEISSR